MYASYEFYKDTFGGLLSETDYRKYELRAEAYIRYLTYVNGDIFASEDDAVKMAVCAATDVIAAILKTDAATGAQTAGRIKKSESTDGYNVTYADDGTSSAEEALRAKILAAIEVYLLPTGWLCRVMTERNCHDSKCGSDDL